MGLWRRAYWCSSYGWDSTTTRACVRACAPSPPSRSSSVGLYVVPASILRSVLPDGSGAVFAFLCLVQPCRAHPFLSMSCDTCLLGLRFSSNTNGIFNPVFRFIMILDTFPIASVTNDCKRKTQKEHRFFVLFPDVRCLKNGSARLAPGGSWGGNPRGPSVHLQSQELSCACLRLLL